MANFKTLEANFKVSIMVEHGAIAFFLNGEEIFSGKNTISRLEKVLPPGDYNYQWQINGKKGVTNYSIRIMLNGNFLPSSGVGPRKLKSGDIDLNGDNFKVIE